MLAPGTQPSLRRPLAGLVLIASTVAIAACSTEPMTPNPCTVPPVLLTPEIAHLGIGDTVLAKAALNGPPECRPIAMSLRSLRWRVTDTSIARVSAIKGYVVAKKPGVVIVTVYYPADNSSWGQIRVTVVP